MSLPAPRVDREGLVSRTDPLDEVPELIAHLPTAGGVAWIREGKGFIGWGEAARVPVGTGPGRFQRAAAVVEELLSTAEVSNAVGGWGTGPLAFGSFAFDADSTASAVAIPAVVIGASGGRAWVTRTSSRDGLAAARTEAGEPESPAPAAAGPVEALDEESFTQAVEAARDAIRTGRLDKVVLSLQVVATSASSFDQRAVLARLAAEYPQCYTFAFDSFVGASPELLVRREGRALRSQPLAGSSRRGESPEEDAELGAALAASPKDRWEHDLAVVTVVEALHPLCRTLRIDPEPSCTTARLFAGCGIVAQSDPRAELEEARLKLRPVRSALGIA